MLNQIDLSRTDLNLLVLFEVVLEERHARSRGGTAPADAIGASATASAASGRSSTTRCSCGRRRASYRPRGATELSAPIAELLARARTIVATATPFDPATSTRRFTIGAPDGASAVFPPLLAAIRTEAPHVDIAIRQLLPVAGVVSPDQAWRDGLADLEARAMDMAVIPTGGVPARFEARQIYAEDFVIAMRKGHAFGRRAGLDRFAEMEHLVVSMTGDPHGFVDAALAEQGRSRRVAPTVPNFMFALAVLADTDLVAALPRRLVAAARPAFWRRSGRGALAAAALPDARRRAEGGADGRRARLAAVFLERTAPR